LTDIKICQTQAVHHHNV